MLSFDRLKQRKVFHWAAAYLAGAWVLLQVSSLLADPFHWPEIVMRSVTVLLVVGFLAVLVLAWYHGERGAQRVTTIEVVMLVAILVIAGAGLRLVVPNGAPNASAASPSPEVEQASIAVLPFVNMSGDRENEYFSDGVTEEILNVLAQATGLRVAARTSSFAFKNSKDVTINRIADSLRVAHVLEGSVRKAGNSVRITAQLNTRDGYHVWSHAYERDLKDVFAIQEEIARAIVDTLQVRLMGRAAPRVRGVTANADAHDLYLLGLYHWNRRSGPDILRAIELFEQAVQADPKYALAHAGVANAYAVAPFYTEIPATNAIPKARDAIKHVLALDSTLAEPYATLGDIVLHFERDLPRAEALLLRALQINPAYATAHTWYAEMLNAAGRFDEAEREAARAFELDPLSPRINANYASELEARHPERAMAQYKRALDLSPDFRGARLGLGHMFIVQGKWDEAIAQLRTVQDSALTDRIVRGIADSGRKVDAIAALESMADQGMWQTDVSRYYMYLHETERALKALEKADRLNDPVLVFVRVLPAYAPLRGNPRFERLFTPIKRF
jgi:TolB-like protein